VIRRNLWVATSCLLGVVSPVHAGDGPGAPATTIAGAPAPVAATAPAATAPAPAAAAAPSATAANGPVSVSASNGAPVQVVERSNPKVIGVVPAGWKIVPLDEAKMESDLIEIRPGVTQTIQVSPYKLIPDQPRMAVKDPGFDPALGNGQSSTIGAALTRYNEEAAQLATRLQAAIKTLNSILPPPAENPLPAKHTQGTKRSHHSSS
jgi:hypothetical protein